MAHFAKLESNTVTQVIVVSNDDCAGGDFPASEVAGQTFIASLGLVGDWKQTSYNSNFRKQYAGIGFAYDADADQFVAPQPYPSWTLDANNDWQPPVAKPADGKAYNWNEDTQAWVELPAG